MTREEVLQIIVNNVYDILPELADRKINEADSLREIGANSIDRSDIIISTLENLELKIPMVMFGNAKNIGEIITIVLNNMT